jgi:hypothetical protein
MSRGQGGGSLTVVNLSFLDRSRYFFLSSGSSIILTRKKKVYLRSVRRLLVRASVVPGSPFLVTLKKEALSSSET